MVKTQHSSMFISDVEKKDECKSGALQELRKLGIKCRPKKPKQSTINKSSTRVFKVPLGNLPQRTTTLKTGQQVAVPEVILDLCQLVINNVYTEGIFRKEGSKNRQNEMKLTLNNGSPLSETDNVIDVAVIIKIFLRELPEPLIPFGYHELFLRCALLDQPQRTKALLLACLLLPTEYLNTLVYLMQFFHEVAEFAKYNKMTAYNLAVVIGPNIFPIEKLSQTSMQVRQSKTCDIIQILIENATEIGVIPESIINSMDPYALDGDGKKKKRRSGSLTRMFNGLKKMVGGNKSVEDNHNVVTPDLLLTPINSNAMKKRRNQTNGISNKKKKELLNKLPENVLLNTPFTPCRTPVSMDLCGPQGKQSKGRNEIAKEKKSQWFLRSKSVKNLKHEENYKNSINPKTAIERRWSAISQPSNIRKLKKRNSFAAVNHKENIDQNENHRNLPEPDYIKVSKIEYEAIKNRVSAMERRISIELDSVESQIKTENENNRNVEVDTDIEHVQTVYETLVHSEHLSPTTDQLAKRLSRELKIRRSAEQKIIRSPSARKIGSMRRKSKEMEKSNSKISRHQSWHAPRKEKIETIPRVTLKRGRPNTVLTGLPVIDNDVIETKELNRTRSSSVGDQSKRSVSCNLSGSSDTWVSAEGFFATVNSKNDSSSFNDRASLARLRSQNAGMVLAKAKLFDKLKDSDSSSSSSLVRNIPRAKVNTKIGSNRNMDSRLSYRVRTLKYEERRLKKSMSPRKRNGQLSQKHKLQIAKQYLDSSGEKSSNKENIPDNFNTMDKNLVVPIKDCNRMEGQAMSPKYSTPRAPPHIKKSLSVKSPKRLCRTPVGVERCTPLRVLKTPIHNHV